MNPKESRDMYRSICRAAAPVFAAFMLACFAAGLRPGRAAEPQATKKFVYMPIVLRELAPVAPGYWKGGANQFYVTPDSSKVNKFAVRINVTGCGSYKVTRTSMVPIGDKKFEFINYYFSGSGTFTAPKTASGTDRLNQLYIAGCGYVSGGPWAWSATWQDNSQPGVAASSNEGMVFVTAEVVANQAARPAEGDAEYIVEQIAPAESAPAVAAPATIPTTETRQHQAEIGDDRLVEPAQ
jgi:hypothetical protein